MSEKIRLCLRLKSGKEFHFSCDKYTITRNNATGELLRFTYESAFGECPQYFSIKDVESISRIPTEEPKTGEWILECDSEGEGDNLYRCSECGGKCGCQEYDKPNFCPDCGADMRGENHE